MKRVSFEAGSWEVSGERQDEPGRERVGYPHVRTGILILLLCSRVAAAQQDPDPWFAPDKALHFSFSAGIAGLGYGGAALFTEDRNVRLAVGAGLALTAGVTKELLDLAGLGQPSWKDLAWDLAGTATGVLLSWLLDLLVTSFTSPCVSGVRAPCHGG